MQKAIFAPYIYADGAVLENHWLVIENDVIAAITEAIDESAMETIIRRDNAVIIPGLVNTHTHLPMVYFRGMADDMPLMTWLQEHIWPAEGAWLSNEFVADATMLAACEMIRCGCTAAADMYFYSTRIAESLTACGLRGVVGVGVLDFPSGFAQSADEYIEKAGIVYDRFVDDELIDVALCPHAPYTASPETYKKSITFAEQRNMLIHTHLSETAFEVSEAKKNFGTTPARLMNDIGMFDTNAIFAHCVHVDEEEIDLMGKKNVRVSHCVESNLKLGSGFAPVKKMMDAGALVSIGTDGAASNNDLDMLGEMSTVAKLHKGLNMDPTVLDAHTVLDMATKNGAASLGLEGTGVLKVGAKADFAVVSLDDVNVTPVYNPISHVVYSAKSSDVSDVYVNGRCLMDGGVITVCDVEEVKDKARHWAVKIKNGK